MLQFPVMGVYMFSDVFCALGLTWTALSFPCIKIEWDVSINFPMSIFSEQLSHSLLDIFSDFEVSSLTVHFSVSEQ